MKTKILILVLLVVVLAVVGNDTWLGINLLQDYGVVATFAHIGVLMASGMVICLALMNKMNMISWE